jgi:hypothetical protein
MSYCFWVTVLTVQIVSSWKEHHTFDPGKIYIHITCVTVIQEVEFVNHKEKL